MLPPDLLQQSGETLAGRISYVELDPVGALEVASNNLDRLWLRGVFPDSLLAADDAASLRWRQDFIRSYLERDIPQLGPRIPAETLRQFWTMLAHHQSGLLNAAQFAQGLGVDGKTVVRYLDLLVDLLLVRRLPSWQRNVAECRQATSQSAQGLCARQRHCTCPAGAAGPGNQKHRGDQPDRLGQYPFSGGIVNPPAMELAGLSRCPSCLPCLPCFPWTRSHRNGQQAAFQIPAGPPAAGN